MAGVKSTGEYDYIKPDEKREYRNKVEPAGKYDSNFNIVGIALQEIVKDNDTVTKKTTTMRTTNAVKREAILSTDLFEGMSIKASNNKEIER